MFGYIKFFLIAYHAVVGDSWCIHFVPANRNGAGPLVFQRAALFKVTIIFQLRDMKTLHVCWYLAVEFLFSVGEDPVPL